MRDDIVDTNKPSPGRMYDYFLGGSHNFQVDRDAGDATLAAVPFLKNFALLQRWALTDIAEEMTYNRGFDVIIDYASGLPTADHIHNHVPAGTTVIYSDYDPIVVEYALGILQDTPNVYFFKADVARPLELLEQPDVQKILAGRRKVALCVWGVSGFLQDGEIASAMQSLYDWADSGSSLAFNAQVMDINLEDPDIIEMFRIYQNFGQDGHPRSSALFNKLIQPWKMEPSGWIDLLKWHGFEQSSLSSRDKKSFGPVGGGYGAYLYK
jgi:S-adenosyl methyltransferase